MQHPWLKNQNAAPDKPIDNIVLSRMRKFAAMNKLKQAALLVMAKKLNPADIEGLKLLFRSIDTDDSGTITVEEMKDAIAKMGNKIQVRPPWLLQQPVAADQHAVGGACGMPCPACGCLVEPGHRVETQRETREGQTQALEA